MAAHDQILFQTSVANLLPPVGTLVPGHLLITSRSHIFSLAQLGIRDLERLDTTLSGLCTVLGREFGEYYLFEHGSSSAEASGPCISHAHVHLMPLAALMAEKLIRAMPWSRLPNYQALAQYRDCEYAYLRVGKQHLVHPNPSIKSQWIRRQAAEALNRDDWDWYLTRSDRELRETLRGITRLRNLVLKPSLQLSIRTSPQGRLPSMTQRSETKI